ncbi:MAG: asparaginase [Flavobacteriaceae bacterium]|nr:asparaginase [Bacteroidia bacterium]NNK88702.1 asparaginase [Flavobacteriaceae bacterium]
MDLPKILIIYTGGTIGMIKNPESGVLQAFDFDHLLEKIPEINLLNCTFESTALEQPLDSSNMNPSHWATIAKIVEDNYKSFDGFVILHGSDTMSYTASALSFMFENLDKPIILTGSQLPIGDLRTDAKENLITALQIASLRKDGKALVREVCLYFEYKLYRGNRTTKINAEHFQAFASLNYPDLGESGVHLKIKERYLSRFSDDQPFSVHYALEDQIALIKLFPGITPAVLSCMCSSEDLKGIILETFGAGNATTETWFIEIISQAIKRGIHVVSVSQCSGGSVMMGRYETSEQLEAIGVISGHDLTTEAAIAKMMYLLSMSMTTSEFRQTFERSIRGELTEK